MRSAEESCKQTYDYNFVAQTNAIFRNSFVSSENILWYPSYVIVRKTCAPKREDRYVYRVRLSWVVKPTCVPDQTGLLYQADC